MNLLIITITLCFIHTSTANEQNAEKEVTTLSFSEPLPPEDDIVFAEPKLALKDAVAESEIVTSNHRRDEEFLIDEDLHVNDQSNSKSNLDGELLDDIIPNNADTESGSNGIKSNNTDTISASNEELVELRLNDKVDKTDASERNRGNDNTVRNTKFESAKSDSEDTANVSKERVSVEKDNDKNRSDTVADVEVLSRRMMPNEVVDTKARSGERRDLRVGNSMMRQPKTHHGVTHRPLELPRQPHPTTQHNRLEFLPYLSNLPAVYYPNQEQSFRNLQIPEPPRFNTDELTNLFVRMNSYPAKERFHSSLSNEQFTQLSQLANYNSPYLNDMYLKHTEIPPVNFKSNTPVNPIYLQTYTTTYDMQKFNQYDSLFRPINI